jgi:hypothetical protein
LLAPIGVLISHSIILCKALVSWWQGWIIFALWITRVWANVSVGKKDNCMILKNMSHRKTANSINRQNKKTAIIGKSTTTIKIFGTDK